MTLLLLLSLIYAVCGGMTAMEIRSIGIPSLGHECDSYDRCMGEYRNTWRCPGRWVGRGPLTLFGWVGAFAFWPWVWAYVIASVVMSVILWVGTRRL